MSSKVNIVVWNAWIPTSDHILLVVAWAPQCRSRGVWITKESLIDLPWVTNKYAYIYTYTYIFIIHVLHLFIIYKYIYLLYWFVYLLFIIYLYCWHVFLPQFMVWIFHSLQLPTSATAGSQLSCQCPRHCRPRRRKRSKETAADGELIWKNSWSEGDVMAKIGKIYGMMVMIIDDQF